MNRCYYCLVAHGAAVRALSGDPALGELMVMNYRAARLSKRQRAMLDFAVKLTAEPWAIEEDDREALRKAGFADRDIWDIAAVAGFYNMTQPRRVGDRHAAEQRLSRAGAVKRAVDSLHLDVVLAHHLAPARRLVAHELRVVAAASRPPATAPCLAKALADLVGILQDLSQARC